FVIASGISAVLAQRLARRLCEHCRQEYEPSADELEKVGLDATIEHLWRPGSCDRCTRGYRGRVGIFQLLVMHAVAGRLAALAAGVGLSANAHRSPCHLSHSCPSDHHSYVWFDAAGQGWDCAKVGAPEVTAADTQRIYDDGLAYQCRRAGGKQAATCGTEAWA